MVKRLIKEAVVYPIKVRGVVWPIAPQPSGCGQLSRYDYSIKFKGWKGVWSAHKVIAQLSSQCCVCESMLCVCVWGCGCDQEDDYSS